MRRVVRLAAVAMGFALVAGACSKSPNSTTGGTPSAKPGNGEKIGMVYDLAGRGDKSFNDSAYIGLTKASHDFNIQVKDLTPSASGQGRQALMRLLATDGYPLIFGNGFAFDADIAAVAKDYPNIKFAETDGGVADLTSSSNLVMNDFAANEGSFLVGAAAALTSKSGKVGFIGGVDVGLIHSFQAGFEAGAKQV